MYYSSQCRASWRHEMPRSCLSDRTSPIPVSLLHECCAIMCGCAVVIELAVKDFVLKAKKKLSPQSPHSRVPTPHNSHSRVVQTGLQYCTDLDCTFQGCRDYLVPRYHIYKDFTRRRAHQARVYVRCCAVSYSELVALTDSYA